MEEAAQNGAGMELNVPYKSNDGIADALPPLSTRVDDARAAQESVDDYPLRTREEGGPLLVSPPDAGTPTQSIPAQGQRGSMLHVRPQTWNNIAMQTQPYGVADVQNTMPFGLQQVGTPYNAFTTYFEVFGLSVPHEWTKMSMGAKLLVVAGIVALVAGIVYFVRERKEKKA